MGEEEKPFHEEYWWVILLIVLAILVAVAAVYAYKKGLFRKSSSGSQSAAIDMEDGLPKVGAY